MKREIMILLPETIYIKRMKENQGIVTMPEEYNIYFKNIVQPYDEKWDIQVRCEYGSNLGNCWRIADYKGDADEFEFELVIYDEYGERIASKKSCIVMVERKENASTKVLFFGDSMTHSQNYVNHIVSSLRGIETIGSRCFDGHVKHEGRGGWAYDSYYKRYYEEYGVSPFLFPKNVEAEDYYGDKKFNDGVSNENSETYQYYGFRCDKLQDGQYYTFDKKLYKKNAENDELISENPEYEFSFAKYLEKFDLDKPEIVSVLLGANDLQICPYEESAEKVEKYIENTKKFIEEIHKCDSNIKIIVNMPVLGAEQYCWGTKLGCIGSEKMYRHNIMKAANEILKCFDNRQQENIYVSPMLACLDVENGFPHTYEKANMYSEQMLKRQSNWVHPNLAGYCQMGDALAAVIEYIR